MVPTIISHQKQRKPRRDKLPPAEKHTRHLEASRNYYARNKMRIQEEQRLRTRKRRQKQKEGKLAKQMPGIHGNVCPFCQCGRLFPRREALVDDDDNRSVDEGDDKDSDADSEMGSLEN